jgi:hypothetical protein
MRDQILHRPTPMKNSVIALLAITVGTGWQNEMKEKHDE